MAQALEWAASGRLTLDTKCKPEPVPGGDVYEAALALLESPLEGQGEEIYETLTEDMPQHWTIKVLPEGESVSKRERQLVRAMNESKIRAAATLTDAFIYNLDRLDSLVRRQAGDAHALVPSESDDELRTIQTAILEILGLIDLKEAVDDIRKRIEQAETLRDKVLSEISSRLMRNQERLRERLGSNVQEVPSAHPTIHELLGCISEICKLTYMFAYLRYDTLRLFLIQIGDLEAFIRRGPEVAPEAFLGMVDAICSGVPSEEAGSRLLDGVRQALDLLHERHSRRDPAMEERC